MTQNNRVHRPRADRGLLAAAAVISLLTAAGVPAPAAAEQLAVPLSRPGQPAAFHASGLNATFTVEGYDGQEVIVEAEASGEEASERRGSGSAPPPGMRRLPNPGFGLAVEEEDNVVELSVQGFAEQRIRVRVPRNTSVNVSSVNGGDIHVQGVHGSHEIGHVNGAITARDVSGTVVAHTTNGDVKATLARIESGKPMSFVSFNGDVDVTFPAGLAADLKLRSDQGEIFTDFEVAVKQAAPARREDASGGKFRLTLERSLEASVGGGGPEVTLRTFNGNIYVRKAR
ncbi:MAG TPA: hypothetical protein VJG13_00115 [Thermoanaerobaculia bacterium]|nr:hypothetical protein [Thermoanaerobaculia bacterium]